MYCIHSDALQHVGNSTTEATGPTSECRRQCHKQSVWPSRLTRRSRTVAMQNCRQQNTGRKWKWNWFQGRFVGRGLKSLRKKYHQGPQLICFHRTIFIKYVKLRCVSARTVTSQKRLCNQKMKKENENNVSSFDFADTNMLNKGTPFCSSHALRRKGFLLREWETYLIIFACSRNELCLEYSQIICFSLTGILWEYAVWAWTFKLWNCRFPRYKSPQGQVTGPRRWRVVWTFSKTQVQHIQNWSKLCKNSQVSLESSYITIRFLQYITGVWWCFWLFLWYASRSGKGLESIATIVWDGKRAWWDVDEDLQRIQRLCPGVFVLKEQWKCGNLKIPEYLATLTSALSNIMHILILLDSFTIFDHARPWLHHTTTLCLHHDYVMTASWLLKSATNSKIETKLQWCHRCPVGEAFEVSQLFSLVAGENWPSNWIIFEWHLFFMFADWLSKRSLLQV